MLLLFSVVALALFALTINSHPALPSSDYAGLITDLGLDLDQFSTVGIDLGASFSSLYGPPSVNPEAPSSQQLALNVDSSASAPLPASQDQGCDKTPQGKRDTGAPEDTVCPAILTIPSPPGTAQETSPKKTPEGQQQQNSAPLRPTNASLKKPGRKGDLRLTPEEPLRIPFGQEEQDSQCPPQYKYSVCGIEDGNYYTWGTLHTLIEADLVINFGFGSGLVIPPGKFISSFQTLSRFDKLPH